MCIRDRLGLKFFLAKGPDVPTYVEYGAADIGVAGKDTLVEEGRKMYEVLDLGFGKCRMCVCGPESAREKLAHQEQIRVATKYPDIAKEMCIRDRRYAENQEQGFKAGSSFRFPVRMAGRYHRAGYLWL